jgi:hypothetical protein
MIRLGAVCLLLLFLTSCENAFYPLASQTTQDPSISTPSIIAFSSLLGNSVTWSKDSNADSYVVYRRLLTSTTYSQVYQGSDLSFLDTTAAPDTMYAYTLAKYRGSKLFPSGGSAVGAWDSSYTAFPNGVNNTQATAVPVPDYTFSMAGTIFYYSTATDALTGQQVLINHPNWYYIDLPPTMEAYIIFNYANTLQGTDGFLVVNSTNTNNSPVTVYTGNEIGFFNGAITTQRVYFNVQFNTSWASTNTQTLVNYQMVFKNSETYTP